jgi:hemerythrin
MEDDYGLRTQLIKNLLEKGATINKEALDWLVDHIRERDAATIRRIQTRVEKVHTELKHSTDYGEGIT